MKEKLIFAIVSVFPTLDEKMSAELKNYLACYNQECLADFHFSIGIWIRNNLLIDNEELYNIFVQYGIENMDDMSALIIQLYWKYLKKTKE